MAGPGVISFTRTERYSSLVAEEKEMRDARVFSDFTICINEESIPCHRLVLSVHSAMMKAMLTSDMTEATKRSVNLDHIDLDVMKVILDYMYVGQVSFHVKQLSDMIIACDYLQINMLKDMCVDQVPSILQPTNVVLWFKLSHELDLRDVKSQCLEIIVASFTTISRQPAFIDLSLVNFQECLTHVQQSSQQQDDVLDAALKWVDRDTSERLDHLETLVDQIQLDLCSLQGILVAMKTYKTMITTTETLYDRLTTAAMEISTKAKVPSKPTLTIIGGTIHDLVSRVCWKLNEKNEVVKMLRLSFDDLQPYHSVCATPGGFIISGGEGSTLCIMFNAKTMKWSRLQDMMTNRDCHGSVSIRGVLYALGGYMDRAEDKSKSVHSLVIEGGSWQEESDLPNCLALPKVVELDESMYLLDESNGQLLHMDVDQKVWTRKGSLPTKTYGGISMTSHNGKLYVAREGLFAWYTPATDTWVKGQKPAKRHFYGSLIHHEKKLLLLGGSHEGGTDEVEEFDFEDKTWSVSAWKMPAPLYGHHALVLDIPNET